MARRLVLLGAIVPTHSHGQHVQLEVQGVVVVQQVEDVATNRESCDLHSPHVPWPQSRPPLCPVGTAARSSTRGLALTLLRLALLRQPSVRAPHHIHKRRNYI